MTVTVEGPGAYRGETGGAGVRFLFDVASSDGTPIERLDVDPGNGSGSFNLVRPGSSSATSKGVLEHEYSARGLHESTWTATLAGGATQTRTVKVHLPSRVLASPGQFTFDLGWSESFQTRELLDLNGDGKADIIGFGRNGVWVSLSLGVGFDAAFRATGEFALTAANATYEKRRWPMQLGDVNGDGRPDIVFFASDPVAPLMTNYIGAGTYVALNDGSGHFGRATRWTADFGEDAYPGADFHPRRVVDVNGDDRADIVGFGRQGVRIGLSNGSSAFTSPSGSAVVIQALGSDQAAGEWTDAHLRSTGDINGDGHADLIGFGQNGLEVWLNCAGGGAGTATGCTSAGASTIRFARQFHPGWFSTSAGWNVRDHPRFVADVDGDGDDDVVGFYNDGVHVAAAVNGVLQGDAATGDPTLAVAQFGRVQGWLTANDPRALADVTGDGLVDVVGVGPMRGPNTDGGVAFAANLGLRDTAAQFRMPNFVSTGVWLKDFSAFRTVPSTNPALFWNETDFPRRFADVNGDGRADLVVFGLNAVIAEFAVTTLP
jgi:hypothetical protein